MSDFKPISAEYARDLAINYKRQQDLLKNLFSQITEAAKRGESYINYETDGKHFSDIELNYLKELGYTVEWNSACLWYEISWSN